MRCPLPLLPFIVLKLASTVYIQIAFPIEFVVALLGCTRAFTLAPLGGVGHWKMAKWDEAQTEQKKVKLKKEWRSLHC